MASRETIFKKKIDELVENVEDPSDPDCYVGKDGLILLCDFAHEK